MLLLDFDGLICDTERTSLQAWQDFYDRLGVPFDARLRARMAGVSGGGALALSDLRIRLGRPLTQAEREWQRRRKHDLADRAAAMPGIAWLIGTAHAAGHGVAVVSSSPAAWLERHLTRLGLRQAMSFLVSGDDTVRHKPAPDLYLLALARAGCPAEQALAVEDSAPGVAAARAAGLRCVAVADAPSVEGADAVLPDLHQLDLSRWLTDVRQSITH